MNVWSVGLWLLGGAWGCVAGAPIAWRAERLDAMTRASALSVRVAVDRRRLHVLDRASGLVRAHADDTGLRVVAALLTRHRTRRTDSALRRELPVALDLLGVAVGAGCTPYLALEVTAQWSPAPLAAAFSEVLRSCALGLDLEAALEGVVRSTPALQPLAAALLASDRLGVPVGPMLARLAEEDRRALRRSAEAHARRIPVRLLFPLVFLVLPAFVLLTVVPGLAAGLGRL